MIDVYFLPLLLMKKNKKTKNKQTKNRNNMHIFWLPDIKAKRKSSAKRKLVSVLPPRRINYIRHYLSQDALKTLISAFALSRIDYCNFPLAGCPKQFIHKLQKKFRTTLQGSSVELLMLVTYLTSFTLFTGVLLNKEFYTNCLSLSLNL